MSKHYTTPCPFRKQAKLYSPSLTRRNASRASRPTRWIRLSPLTSALGIGLDSIKTEATQRKQQGRQDQRGPDPRASGTSRKPSVVELRQFEKLWLEYRHELQFSKQAAANIINEVRKGRLPCDAQLLRNRVCELHVLDPLQPRLRLRQLLAAAPASLLLHDPRLLVARAAKFAALLPSYDTTHLLMTVMPHLDREPHVTAMNFVELDDVFGRAFGGARVPPSAFAHLLRAHGASVLPPPAVAVPPAAAARQSEARVQTVPASRWESGLGPDPEAHAAVLGGEEGAGAAAGAEERELEELAQSGRPEPAGSGPGAINAQLEAQVRAPARGPVAAWGSPEQQRRWREISLQQRRYVDPLRLLTQLKELVSSFGRETAYVAVQRHPALLDRGPTDLARRLAQLLMAVDPRLAGQPDSAATVRATARVLEDAPEVLDVDLGELRRRLAGLSATLEWDTEQVGLLALHDPAVLLRDPRDCRENLFRLRLYALRRPATWGAELKVCLRPPHGTGAAAAPSAVRSPLASETNAAPLRPLPDGDGAFTTSGAWDRNPDPDQLSLLSRILTADDEVLGRFEYLVASRERQEVALRELVRESRVKFARQCPSYSRWWAEGAARARGEGAGPLGLVDAADGGGAGGRWRPAEQAGEQAAGIERRRSVVVWDDAADEAEVDEWEDDEEGLLDML